MRKLLLMLLAVITMLVGCVTLFSPIPGGSLVLPFGASILVTESPAFRRLLRWIRRQLPTLNRVVVWFEQILSQNRYGKRIGGVIARTNPNRPYMPESVVVSESTNSVATSGTEA